MYRRSGRGDLDVRALLTAPLAAQRMVRLQQWVFVQKCLLERKRSYLTEKGLFSRKAIAEGPKVRLTLRWRELNSNHRSRSYDRVSAVAEGRCRTDKPDGVI